MMADVEEVEVVVAHNERATLRVGDVFLKIDVEVEAMAMAPIPTPTVLWRKPPVLALAALPGTVLGRLGEPSTASSAAWAAVGAATRMLHDAPLPPWPGRSLNDIAYILIGAHRYKTALPFAKKAYRNTHDYPVHAFATFNLGYVYLRLRKCKKALPLLKAALQHEPKDQRQYVKNRISFAEKVTCRRGASAQGR